MRAGEQLKLPTRQKSGPKRVAKTYEIPTSCVMTLHSLVNLWSLWGICGAPTLCRQLTGRAVGTKSAVGIQFREYGADVVPKDRQIRFSNMTPVILDFEPDSAFIQVSAGRTHGFTQY